MSETIHRRKFMDGQATPGGVHHKLGLRGARCRGCGAPAYAVARVHVLLADLKPDVRAAMEVASLAQGLSSLPLVKLKAGDAVCVSEVHFCQGCRASVAKALAKGPSYAFVDIDFGPGEDRVVVQVPRPGEPIPVIVPQGDPA